MAMNLSEVSNAFGAGSTVSVDGGTQGLVMLASAAAIGSGLVAALALARHLRKATHRPASPKHAARARRGSPDPECPRGCRQRDG